ncbi:MAG: TonB-dependent receptor plug domain-containing protein, partial [Pseudomonadales bacterium]|nr:TonB-dependent receptor plug domain-containing protein [Pseudomonadales bacterium]
MIYRNFHSLAVGLSLAILPGATAIASDGGQPLEEVVVTAVRMSAPAKALPNRVTLIDRSALSEQLAISTSTLDALGTNVPSFAPTRQKMTGSGETMRGREPLYMIDGVPQSNPLRNGQRDGFTLDPAVIDRIEVLYGANAIQGIGATGGIVNYVTRSAAAEPRTNVELGFTSGGAGASDGYGTRASVTTAQQLGAVDVVASVAAERRGAFYDANGDRVGVDNVQGDIQDSQSLNLFTKLGWNAGDNTRMQLMLNKVDLEGDGDYVPVTGDRDLGIPVISVRGDFDGSPPENKVRTASLDVTHDFTNGSTLKGQLYYQDFESVFGGGRFGTFQDPAIDPSGNLFDQSSNNSEKHGLKL